jgi:hypothetical protein
MTFDPFKQSKLMTAYTGMNTVEMPPGKEIDSIDDLKRLAGVTGTSYGETISQNGTNFGQIQRERNIRPGSDEWFRLWFSKPLLTGEKPYDK